MAWYSFAAVYIFTALYFALHCRRFDLLAISAIGSAFYFSPMLIGRVLVPYGYDPTIPDQVYWIATTIMLSLVVTGYLNSAWPAQPYSGDVRLRLSAWYTLFSVACLIVAIVVTHGAIINPDKTIALQNVGYFFMAFEISASLACISAVLERRWAVLAFGCALLCVDLQVGFRVFTTLTMLAIGYVQLSRQPAIMLVRKLPTFGAAFVAISLGLFLVQSARYAIFEQLYAATGKMPVATETAKMRSDTLQFALAAQAQRPEPPKSVVGIHIPDQLIGALSMFEQSEPFNVQSILSETVRQDYSCHASNILKSLTLIPGASRLLPTFPMTFYDEYQPILFPTITYGLGGNIWAEMLCRFGYAGMVVFGLLFVVTLIGLDRMIAISSPTAAPPLTFCGIIIAFYIYRNDMHYTLVMMRQTLFVFLAVLFIAWSSQRLIAPLLVRKEHMA